MEAKEGQIQVLVVDDDEDTRIILADYLAHHGYDPHPAMNGGEALALAEALSPSLALVDIRLPDMPGTKLAARLKELCPEVVVIFITAYGSTELAVEAMHAGAFYYLVKPLSLGKVLEVLDKARAVYVARTPTPMDLTQRERDILTLLAQGDSNRQIAEQLGLTEQSVKNRLRGIYGKLGVSNRGQAIVRAIELKLTRKG